MKKLSALSIKNLFFVLSFFILTLVALPISSVAGSVYSGVIIAVPIIGLIFSIIIYVLSIFNKVNYKLLSVITSLFLILKSIFECVFYFLCGNQVYEVTSPGIAFYFAISIIGLLIGVYTLITSVVPKLNNQNSLLLNKFVIISSSIFLVLLTFLNKPALFMFGQLPLVFAQDVSSASIGIFLICSSIFIFSFCVKKVQIKKILLVVLISLFVAVVCYITISNTFYSIINGYIDSYELYRYIILQVLPLLVEVGLGIVSILLILKKNNFLVPGIIFAAITLLSLINDLFNYNSHNEPVLLIFLIILQVTLFITILINTISEEKNSYLIHILQATSAALSIILCFIYTGSSLKLDLYVFFHYIALVVSLISMLIKLNLNSINYEKVSISDFLQNKMVKNLIFVLIVGLLIALSTTPSIKMIIYDYIEDRNNGYRIAAIPNLIFTFTILSLFIVFIFAHLVKKESLKRNIVFSIIIISAVFIVLSNLINIMISASRYEYITDDVIIVGLLFFAISIGCIITYFKKGNAVSYLNVVFYSLIGYIVITAVLTLIPAADFKNTKTLYFSNVSTILIILSIVCCLISIKNRNKKMYNTSLISLGLLSLLSFLNIQFKVKYMLQEDILHFSYSQSIAVVNTAFMILIACLVYLSDTHMLTIPKYVKTKRKPLIQKPMQTYNFKNNYDNTLIEKTNSIHSTFKYVGTVKELVFLLIKFSLLSAITFGIYPIFGLEKLLNEIASKIKHPLGYRISFSFTAYDLFSFVLVTSFLSMITLGIYGLFALDRSIKWILRHTYLIDKGKIHCFADLQGDVFGSIWRSIAYSFLIGISMGFATPYVLMSSTRFILENYVHITGFNISHKFFEENITEREKFVETYLKNYIFTIFSFGFFGFQATKNLSNALLGLIDVVNKQSE